MSAGAERVRRIHIDTDPGLDDLLALALAFASPELRVEGITTVAGNASLDAVTRNAQRFLALAGMDLPLGRGAGEPLDLSPVDAEHFHGPDGRRGVPLPALDRRPAAAASDVLRRSLSERRVEAVVALGPLTNIATLLLQESNLFEDVEIVWMGGCLGPGNATAVSEFNAYADPTAAATVFSSGVAVRVIGLDVTEAVTLVPGNLPRDAFGPSEIGRFLRGVLEAMMEAGEPVDGEPRAALHDPCAVLAASGRDLFRYEPKRIDVVTEEGHERGRLIDRSPPSGPGTPDADTNVSYAVEANVTELKRLFLERLDAWSRGDGR